MGHKYGLVPTISMSEKREKEGLKVIEKFCRKKYATSVIDPVLLEDDNLDRISLQSSKSSSFLVPSSTLQNSSASSPVIF
ncbi:hypothetical protein AB6A40_005181 [Gnathostoma spinigerum]|uniref:Uncharacterized protein n=1 Tax=Gnathostoma spinigerum TaxID=75299 RepID=A0ABD6EPI9_9BILA